MKEFYENEKAPIVSSFNEEIDTYDQKYNKYRVSVHSADFVMSTQLFMRFYLAMNLIRMTLLSVVFQNGYAKVSAYLEEKVWPELSMLRELLNYLPAFPCTEGGDAQEPKPENTIQYWREKIEKTEIENQRLKNEMSCKTKQLTEMPEACANLRKVISDLRSGEIALTKELLLEVRVKELEDSLRTRKHQCDDVEALVNQGDTAMNVGAGC